MTDRAQNGKGSSRRRMSIDQEDFSLNWDRIFSGKKKMWIVTYSTFSGAYEVEFEDYQEAQEFYEDACYECFTASIREG